MHQGLLLPAQAQNIEWLLTSSSYHPVDLNPAVGAFAVLDVVLQDGVAIAADEQLAAVVAVGVLPLAAGDIALVEVAKARLISVVVIIIVLLLVVILSLVVC